MTNHEEIFYKFAYNKEISETFIKDLAINVGDESTSKGLGIYFNSKLKTVEKNNKDIEWYNKEISERIEGDIEELNFKIRKLVEKVRGAILVERNTTSTIFSTIMPINKQQVKEENTTAEIKDGVIFGISTKKLADNVVYPFTLADLKFKNLRIKSINKKALDLLEDFEISNHIHNSSPFEFSIDLKNKIKNDSSIILQLDNHSIIEVYIDNELFRERKLSNYFNIPVNINTSMVSFRVYPTIHKSTTLKFEKLGRTDLVYQDEVVFETKQLPINKNLTHIVLDTCDNNMDDQVNIEYYISLNNKEYERVEEVSKYGRNKLSNTQSIIATSKDVELDLIGSEGVKLNDSEFNYQIPPSLQNLIDFETEVLIPITLNKNYSVLYINVKQDFTINRDLITNNTIFIDGIKEDGVQIILNKGIRRLEVSDGFLNINYLNEVFKTNLYQERIKKQINKSNNTDKHITMTGSELFEYFNEVKPKTIYFKQVSRSEYISTVKIKAKLKSLDFKTVPYISRFLIRGI